MIGDNKEQGAAVEEKAIPAIQSRPINRLFDSPRRRILWLALLLAVATVAVYYPVHSHPFANYDDQEYVTENAHIQPGLTWQTVRWAFTTYYAANWHPLTWLSHEADCQFFGLNPAGPHLVNLLLHVINVLLLFWVLVRATGYVGRSAMVAALFALHPLNVQTAAWIAERKNLLSMLFLLLALGAYRWYARKPRIGIYLLVTFLYALGLMAKPQIVTFPCLLLLWDYWPLRRMFANGPGASLGSVTTDEIPARSLVWLIAEKIPLFALSAASAVLTIKAQFGAGAEEWFPRHIRVENAVLSYGRYLGKTLWPSHLALFYPHPGNNLKISQAVISLVVVLAVTTLAAICWRRRYLTVGWVWFVGTLVPMIGIVQVGGQAMADRYAYLPLIGLFIMICWGVAEVAQQHCIPLAWQAGVSVVLVAALTVLTRQQIDYWRDNEVLWLHTLQVSERNWIAADLVGAALLQKGKIDEAMPYYYWAVALVPSDATANLNIGAYEQRRKNLPAAIERFQKVVDMKGAKSDQRAKAYMNMGYAYRDLGKYTDARESLKQSVALKPDNAEAWRFLGVTAQKTGDLKLAIEAYSRSMAMQPLDWGYVLLGQVLEQSGRTSEAQAAYLQARILSRNYDETKRAAANVLSQ